MFPDEEIEFNADELRRTLTPLMRESNAEGMVVLFREASDVELEQYIAYWSSVDGKRISALLNVAIEAGARDASDVAMQILTGKRQTVP